VVDSVACGIGCCACSLEPDPAATRSPDRADADATRAVVVWSLAPPAPEQATGHTAATARNAHKSDERDAGNIASHYMTDGGAALPRGRSVSRPCEFDREPW
jgi:hypothetical protein